MVQEVYMQIVCIYGSTPKPVRFTSHGCIHMTRGMYNALNKAGSMHGVGTLFIRY